LDTQDFDLAVAAMARQQASRLRAMGFAAAAAEVDDLLPAPSAGAGGESGLLRRGRIQDQ
jgi:hypothetical protein